MKLLSGKRETERTRRAVRRARHRYERHTTRQRLFLILVGIVDATEIA